MFRHSLSECWLQFEFFPSFQLVRAYTCVCVCMHVKSVICSHTCVSQTLHPAAPLSCCHGELLLAHSKCIGVCVCVSSCVQLHVLLLALVCICAHACSCMHTFMETSVHVCRCFCEHLCVCTCTWCTCTCV